MVLSQNAVFWIGVGLALLGIGSQFSEYRSNWLTLAFAIAAVICFFPAFREWIGWNIGIKPERLSIIIMGVVGFVLFASATWIYQRHAELSRQAQAGQPPVPESVASSPRKLEERAEVSNPSPKTGPVKWELESIFTMGTYRGDPTFRFSKFIIHGTNITERPISKISGHIRSNLTGETLQIYIVADGKRVFPEKILNVPSGARLEIVAPFGPNSDDDIKQMLDEPTLLQRFGDSTFEVELDGLREEHRFHREDIEQMIVKGKRLIYGVPKPTIKPKD